jgi:hypothetical protein
MSCKEKELKITCVQRRVVVQISSPLLSLYVAAHVTLRLLPVSGTFCGHVNLQDNSWVTSESATGTERLSLFQFAKTLDLHNHTAVGKPILIFCSGVFGIAEQLIKESAENEASKILYNGLVLLGLCSTIFRIIAHYCL